MFIPKIKYTTSKRLRQLERDIGSAKYKNWRNQVLERDDHTCQGFNKCQAKEDLQIHHIKKWADDPHLRYNVYNGITLCKKCHQKTYGKEKRFEVVFLKKVLLKDRKKNVGD
jgi:5-methylcytosine-specific restriction endonuclease McrA